MEHLKVNPVSSIEGSLHLLSLGQLETFSRVDDDDDSDNERCLNTPELKEEVLEMETVFCEPIQTETWKQTQDQEEEKNTPIPSSTRSSFAQ